MLKILFFTIKPTILFTVRFVNNTFFFIFFDSLTRQQQIVILPPTVFIRFVSKTSFILYCSTQIKTKLRFIFQQFATFLKHQLTFTEHTFLFKVFLRGIGYRFEVFNRFVKVNVGHSHSVFLYIPTTVTIRLLDTQNILLYSSQKQLLGQLSSRLRIFKKPNLYKQKGMLFISLTKDKQSKQLVFKTAVQKKTK